VKKDSLVYVDMRDPPVWWRSRRRSGRCGGPVRTRTPVRSTPTKDGNPFLPVGAPSILSIGMTDSPFKATTDDRGWVTSITVDLVPGKGRKITITTRMSGHGPLLGTTAPPRALVREAADFYYD
jgi:hypothetical protein